MILPGRYYFESRYDSNPYEFLFFLIKYWFSIFPIIIFYTSYKITISLPLLLVSILIFYILYDWLCSENDKKDFYKKTERVGTFRKSVFLYLPFLLLIYYFLIQNIDKFILFIAIACLLIIVFKIHNLIKPSYRPITFLLLYLIKPIFFVPLLDSGFNDYLVFSFLYAIAYLPNYFLKKVLNFESKSFFSSGIFLKLLFILPMAFYTHIYLYFLGIQVFMTLIIFKYRQK